VDNSSIDLVIVQRARDCQVLGEAIKEIDVVRAITKSYERC